MRTRSPQYVSVAPAVPLSPIGTQVFTYRLPDGVTAAAGAVVTIPFGRRRTTGVVTALLRARPKITAKTATPLPDTVLTPEQMQFAYWLAQTMHGGLGFTLRLFLPPKLSHPPAPLVFPTVPSKKKSKLPKELAAGTLAALDGDALRRRRRLQKLIETALSSSEGQVLIVVPEKQMLAGWQAYPVMHAASPPKVLASLGSGAREGSLRVVVGTQKALFLPFKKLRLIIVDEEQFSTHKLWDQYPRLDNRDGARQLAALHQATVVFSASFPSLALYKAIHQDKLPAVLHRPPRLAVSVVPLTGNDRQLHNVLPLAFIDTLKKWRAQKHQVLLLLNRTGEEPAALRHMLHNTFGAFAQHITLATSAVFTAEAENTFSRIAWLFPEYTFAYPDFRSAEHGLVTLARLAHMLPGSEPLTVVTRNLLLAHQLQSLDWQQWYETLLAERKSLQLPPFADAILLTVQGKPPRSVQRQALHVREILEKRFRQDSVPARVQGPFRSLGPQTTPGKHEYHLLLLGKVDQLATAYQDLPIDRADLSPHRIL